jgi:hypothetical protein
MDGDAAIRFNVIWGRPLRANGMKTLTIAIVLAASHVFFWQVFCLAAAAQTRLPAKGTAARIDNCAPIGRTAKGELVYSMKCENPPAPQASSPQQASPAQAEASEAAAPEPEVKRSGLFGMSYEVKRPDR